MKKFILSLSLLLVSGVMLISCNKSSPKDVAKEWLTDFYHQDYDAAKKLSTEDTKKMMTTLQGFTNALPDSVKQRAKAVSINIKSVKEDGNNATVTFTTSEDPKEQPPLKLVKQNDKWLVQFSKGDFMGSEGKDANGGATMAPDNSATPAAPATAEAPMTMPDTAAQH
jgi:hypothetical protein